MGQPGCFCVMRFSIKDFLLEAMGAARTVTTASHVAYNHAAREFWKAQTSYDSGVRASVFALNNVCLLLLLN